MKNLLLAVFTLCAALGVNAQAILPTSWDFETAPSTPAGWTTNTSSFYATGNSGIAGKLNADFQFFQVDFLDEPGQVSYYLKGWVGGGTTSWSGTFTLEESDDGTTWTTLAQYVDNLDVNSYVQYTATPLSTTRHLRWYYTDKQSGANTGIDDVQIDLPVAGPQQEINCTFGGSNVPNSSQIAFSSAVGITSPLTVVVENLGTANTLNISNATITGPAAADYNITNTPGAITAQGNDNLNFDFTPSVGGTRSATLTIDNDDANEDPYVIELYGVGGNFASEPSSAPTNLSFNNVKSYRMEVSYTNSAGDGVLAIRRKGAAPTGAPTDGTTYGPGDAIGDGKVAYVGDAANFWPNHIVANSDYHYAIFAYNGFGGFINYLESTPLTGSQTSAGADIGTYYSGIDASQTSFPVDLGNLINSHSFEWYGNYDETNIRHFAQRDTSNGQKVVDCVYSGEHYVYNLPFDWSYMSREHSYPHSWMPTNPADNPEQPEYNDQHHIFPAQFSDVNQVRTNLPFGEVVTVQGTYLDATIGLDANGNKVYEPRDGFKGDAARAHFYMCTAYDVEGANEDWSLPEYISILVPYGQDEEVLKAWHWADQPDAWEIARNDFVDSLQGNRNPFIDSVDWVCYIRFSDMTYIGSPSFPCSTIPDGIEEGVSFTELAVFPNPAADRFTVTFQAPEGGKVNFRLLDLTGKEVIREQRPVISGSNRFNLSPEVAEGAYLLEIQMNEYVATQRVIIAK